MSMSALLCGFLLGACSERRVDPNADERIEEGCNSSCSTALACDDVDNVGFASVEECVAACQESDKWDELDQCDWADTEFSICFGTLSCEEYAQYYDLVFDGIELPESWPCREEMDRFYDCNPAEPFGPLD